MLDLIDAGFEARIDAEVRSTKTVARIEAESSEQAKRWRVATRLAPTDFAEALEANREVR